MRATAALVENPESFELLGANVEASDEDGLRIISLELDGGAEAVADRLAELIKLLRNQTT